MAAELAQGSARYRQQREGPCASRRKGRPVEKCASFLINILHRIMREKRRRSVLADQGGPQCGRETRGGGMGEEGRQRHLPHSI